MARYHDQDPEPYRKELADILAGAKSMEDLRTKLLAFKHSAERDQKESDKLAREMMTVTHVALTSLK